MMVITDAWLKANAGKERDKVEEVADRDGLSVRASAKGKLVFQMRYRHAGKLCRLDLGSYPKMSLRGARDENDRMRGELEQGHDPRVVRLVEKKAISAGEADTLDALFRDWYDKYVAKAKPAHQQIRRSFEIHVLPELGAMPADQVTLHHWLELLERVAVEAPSIADRILTNAKQMLKWAVKRKRLASNPLFEITAKQDLQIKKGIGRRSLNVEELRQIWHAINRSHVRPPNKLYLKLCLLLGCRHTELRKAHKAHFDLEKKVWTIPPEFHKTGEKTQKDLVRPIIPQIETVIREAMAWSGKSHLLFAGENPNEPRNAQTHLCLPINLTSWMKKKTGVTITPWTIKALRKTARTNLSTLAPPHVAEIMLGHKLPGSWEVYDHYDYLKEMTDAYSAWWLRIVQIVGTDDVLGADQWPRLSTFSAKTIPPTATSFRSRFGQGSVPARTLPSSPRAVGPVD
jgi:integrase